MDEAGMGDYEHELLSIDDACRKDTTDAVAAQLRDAGIKVKRTMYCRAPRSGTTGRNTRSLPPTGTTVLWAFRFGPWPTAAAEAWNEFGWAND